ncbi:MAG TPA: MBL fold metallo-hydrolase [Nocardioides sp.]|nr:MBL fold metallo-hydrolase [Nocardioides sp.]
MQSTEVTLTRVGGPTVLIEVNGVRLLTDPTFDPAGSTYQLGPVTLRKTQGPALSAEAVGAVDAVLLSHDQHPDNLDDGGRAFLSGTPTVLTTRSGAERLGGTATGLQPGTSVEVGSGAATVDVTATEAVHGPPALSHVLGDVTGFLVTAEPGGPAVYVSGDNVDEAAFSAANDRADVRLAVVHAGAARLDAFGPALLTASAEGVRAAAAALPSAQLLVVHDSGWSHLTEGPDRVAALLGPELSGRLLSADVGVPIEVTLTAGD